MYDRGQEPERLGVERARELPAGFVVPRRVDQSGTVSVYGRSHYVAKAYAGQVVYVRYDPQAQLRLFQNRAGHQLHQRAAPEVTTENIQAMTVTNRRDRSKATGAGELPAGIIPGQPDVA